jgi:signal transduction histidine kinase
MLTGRAALARAAERIQIGQHLCTVYDRRDDLLATVQPFVKSGLERGEQCLYLADDNAAGDVLSSMRQSGIDVEAAVARRALVIGGGRGTYLRDGVFRPDAMIEFWGEAIASARADGFSALRIMAEMSWALGGEPSIERLLEYESQANPFLHDQRVVALCHYNRRRFSAASIRGVLQTHPEVIFGGLVCSNPYYVPPDEFLHPDEDSEITRLLRTLVTRERMEEELRLAHERLQNLSRSLAAAQEAERGEVARELHDEFGQLLTAIKMILGRSGHSVPDPVRRQLRDAESLVTGLVNRVRDLSLRLRPAMLDDLGLIPTLRSHIGRYQAQTGVKVNLHVDSMESPRFPGTVETAAYRIVQEALTNVARHARAKEATVRLWTDDKALYVRIDDRGAGFDAGAVDGVGLASMRERAAALGGALTIRAFPGEGVSLTASLPL